MAGWSYRLCALLAAMALAACVSDGEKTDGAGRTPAQPELDLPVSWYREVPAIGEMELAEWWQRFGDTQLTALVTRALQNNTSLAVAAARLQQARALRDLAGSGLSSQVSASVAAENVRQRNVGSENRYRAGLDASWEPDLYGYRRAGLAAGAATVDAQALTLADGQVSVAAEVALTYIELRGVRSGKPLPTPTCAAN